MRRERPGHNLRLVAPVDEAVFRLLDADGLAEPARVLDVSTGAVEGNGRSARTWLRAEIEGPAG